jgi:hypothetical protein
VAECGGIAGRTGCWWSWKGRENCLHPPILPPSSASSLVYQ